MTMTPDTWSVHLWYIERRANAFLPVTEEYFKVALECIHSFISAIIDHMNSQDCRHYRRASIDSSLLEAPTQTG